MSRSPYPVGFTQSVEIVVRPLIVPALVSVLSARIDQFTRTYSGFIGALVQVSEQQDAVHMQLNWVSREHGVEALAKAKDGEPDLFQIASDLQASAMILRTFIVAADIRTRC
ncbi:antibiotic biosynthesis monooxygenase [Pseudomonas sp. PCH199]|uniref:antibiotic biosynthesis monooxygenase n=1 Tax=unclassified Pseudomonas TaxID=196821 RepID=UPI000BDBAD27|nr:MULTISPECIES: antibiotic biosynthesis monooxygenase [unclassified Pseudomonas]MCW8278727.1 antibiotic biosynthesis monooxygenase [Pseudomonas sp. PCH199]PAM81055.1 antibiotic biosynthesis monooxygenase [Pseudomonas sp. ERMR1:02]